MPTKEELEAQLALLATQEDEAPSDNEEEVEDMIRPTREWIGKAKNQLSGEFLSIKKGFNYYFKLNPDLPAPHEVSKDFKGNGEFRKRFQHLIYLQIIKPTPTGQGLKIDEPDAYKKVMDQSGRGIGEEFIMELSGNANKALAEYLYEAEDPTKKIKLRRTGDGNKTKYLFTKGY